MKRKKQGQPEEREKVIYTQRSLPYADFHNRFLQHPELSQGQSQDVGAPCSSPRFKHLRHHHYLPGSALGGSQEIEPEIEPLHSDTELGISYMYVNY